MSDLLVGPQIQQNKSLNFSSIFYFRYESFKQILGNSEMVT